MLKLLTLIMSLLLLPTMASAKSLLLMNTLAPVKEPITIYSRYAVSDLAHRQLVHIVGRMNEMSTKYTFRINVLPGSFGATSARRSLADARIGTRNLLFTSIDVFTLNKHLETVDTDFEYDKMRDFHHVFGFGSSAHGLISSVNAASLDELVAALRKKPVIYYGISNNSPRTKVLSEVFLKHYNLTNIKPVAFRSKNDMLLSLINKEVDFGVTTPENMLVEGTRLMLMGSRETNPYYPETPTGVQIGMDQFVSEAQTFFTVPKQFIAFSEELKPMMAKICMEDEFKKILTAFSRKHNCMETNELTAKIREDYEWYINNQ